MAGTGAVQLELLLVVPEVTRQLLPVLVVVDALLLLVVVLESAR